MQYNKSWALLPATANLLHIVEAAVNIDIWELKNFKLHLFLF